MLVPLMSAYPPSGDGETMYWPGANRSTLVAPYAEKSLILSPPVLEPTVMTFAAVELAGYIGVVSRLAASLPAAATTMTPCAFAYSMAALSAAVVPGPPQDALTTSAPWSTA